MMTLLATDLIVKFYAFLWPLTRIAALMMTAPVFSVEAANARIRLMLALTLTAMVYPMFDWPAIDPFSAAGLMALATEIGIGVVMGMVLQIITAALVVAGQSISASMGLSMANMMDPTLGNVPILAQFLTVMGTLIFFALGGHLVVISALVESFRALPVGQPVKAAEAISKLLTWSSMMFLGGLLVALPVMAILLLINIGLGVITRAAPSLNIFSVGVPASVAAGFVILIIALPGMGNRIHWLWLQGFEQIRNIFGVP